MHGSPAARLNRSPRGSEGGDTVGQYAFHLDASRCTGCKTCIIACKDGYDLGVGTAFRKVYECTGGTTVKDDQGIISTTCFSYYLSLSCNHCLLPVCVEVCPTHAMHKNPDTGLVAVDTKKCIGCGYCHFSCPYNASKVDKEKGHSVKCEGCPDRIRAGGMPLCVQACPARALSFGPAEAMAEKGTRADVAPLPSVQTTSPNLFITACRDARAAGSAEVVVGNEAEVH